MDETSLIRRKLSRVLIRVFFGQPKGYSIIFTEYRNPDKEPDKRLGPISEAFKDVLEGKYKGEYFDGIGKDVIFETPASVMLILRNSVGMKLPKITIQRYVLPTQEVNTGYLWPVIVTKK